MQTTITVPFTTSEVYVKFDKFDAIILTGMLLICGGIALHSLPLALIAGGICLVIIGLVGATADLRRNP